MTVNVNETSDLTFSGDVLQADMPVIVDLWAPWCGPCKMLAPIFAEVSETYSDKVKFCKLNVDDNKETPAKYGVRGIPTLLIFKNGELVGTKVGSASKKDVVTFIDEHL